MSISEARLTRQLSLDLAVKGERGGARPGAGRPRKRSSERGFIEHRARPAHGKSIPVHVTLRVLRDLPSLRDEASEYVIKRAMLDQRAALERTGRTFFQLVHFSIQTDHLHLIAEAADKHGLARGITGLEVRIARALNALLNRRGRVWHERYHRHDLRTPTETRHALRYVLMNTQKHYRVIGDRAFADPFSSAATFDGFTSPPVTFADVAPWPRVTPRTWLLHTGWRRHGLIGPTESPTGRRSR